MNFWTKLSTLGINETMPVYKQKGTMLFNIAMRISMLVLILLGLAMYFLKGLVYVPLGFLFGLPVIALSLFLNYKGKVNISVFLISIFFPLYFMAISIFAKINGEGLNVVLYFAPRFGIIIFSVIPFAVLGFYDTKKAFTGIIVGVIALLSFDYVHNLFGIDLQKLDFGLSVINILIFGITGLFVFFIMIMTFLQKINTQYENIVISQKNELSEKNVEIISQKEEIESQRDEIEAQRDNVVKQRDEIHAQKKHITDSIQYARRIQNAALPPKTIISEEFENFIFFKPRDIVSGDFFWFKTVEKDNNELNIIVAADCTGHGVPGAFVSMLGISFLNEIVNSESSYNAGVILDKLRDRIKISLHQDGSSGEQKDGMDIALCIIDKTNMKLEFAGAHNSLYLLRKNSEGEKDELKIMKADRMPVGIHAIEKPFSTQSIKIYKNDLIYLFSDGYVDQFGGEKVTKFKSKRFKDLLLNISDKNMDEQKTELENNFKNWKGDTEQIDDIIIIGLKIP